MMTLEQLIYGDGNASPQIYIHFYPDKELFVYIDGDKLYSKDTSRSMFERLCKAREQGNVSRIKALILEQSDKENPLIRKVVISARKLALSEIVEGMFFIKGDSVFMEGADNPMPESLIHKLANVVGRNETAEDLEKDPEYYSLINFWLWYQPMSTLNKDGDIFEDTFLTSMLKIYEESNYSELRRVIRDKETKFNIVPDTVNKLVEGLETALKDRIQHLT